MSSNQGLIKKLRVGSDMIFLATLVSLAVFSVFLKSFNVFFPVEQPSVESFLETKLSEYVYAEPEITPNQLPKDLSLFLEKGETITSLLTSEGVRYPKVLEIVKALQSHVNFRRLQEGTQINVTILRETREAPVQVLALSVVKSATEKVELTLQDDGKYKVRTLNKNFVKENRHINGTIQCSLISCMQRHGVPYGVITQLVNAYSSIIDFQRSIYKGDTFEVLFEEQKDDETGRIMGVVLKYASLTTKGEKMPLYSFDTAHAKRTYYNEKGEAAVKNLLLTPINSARISSHFGRRRHPILGYTKLHKGIDFAAPTGTPIFAAGDGIVLKAGTNGGYGRYIKIKHNGTFATAYAHLSRFAPKLKKGMRVQQGQVIGYVGTTGRSTGPHLHYEVIKNGRHINPAKIKSLPSVKLRGNDLKRFKNYVKSIQNELKQAKA